MGVQASRDGRDTRVGDASQMVLASVSAAAFGSSLSDFTLPGGSRGRPRPDAARPLSITFARRPFRRFRGGATGKAVFPEAPGQRGVRCRRPCASDRACSSARMTPTRPQVGRPSARESYRGHVCTPLCRASRREAFQISPQLPHRQYVFSSGFRAVVVMERD